MLLSVSLVNFPSLFHSPQTHINSLASKSLNPLSLSLSLSLSLFLTYIYIYIYISTTVSLSSQSLAFSCCHLPFLKADSLSSGDHPQFCTRMSLDTASERVCYVHCNFCNTILVVNVPCNSLFNDVTIRCGHCSNLLSVNMGAFLQAVHLQDLQKQNLIFQDSIKDCGSSSGANKASVLDSLNNEPARILPTAPPEKRPRVPSAYNRFIKEEIQRIKASNPDITHKEAFSTAAKNWAHFPHTQFALTLNGGNNNNIDEAFSEEGTRTTQGFYYDSDDASRRI